MDELKKWGLVEGDSSEMIAQAEASAGIASGAAGGVAAVPSGSAPTGAQGGRPQKPIDPRLQEIYNGERKTGDRNSVLRGIKQTVSTPLFL